MNNLITFEDKNIETIRLNDKVLFNPYDIGNCLEMSSTTVRSHIRNFNNNQVVKITKSTVGLINNLDIPTSGKSFLTESGVYRLAFKSRSKKVDGFINWITDEVLPTLRKTGSYSIDGTSSELVSVPKQFLDDITNSINELKEIVSNTFTIPANNLIEDNSNMKNDIDIWKSIQINKIEKLIKENEEYADLTTKDILGVIYKKMYDKIDIYAYHKQYRKKHNLSTKPSMFSVVSSCAELRDIFVEAIDILFNVNENESSQVA